MKSFSQFAEEVKKKIVPLKPGEVGLNLFNII